MTAITAERTQRYVLAMFLIVSLFFLWGVANNLNDILIKQFKKAFTLTDLQSGLVQSAFYLGYFLFAIPAAMFMRRAGYKSAVVVGLILYGIGALLFYPAAEYTHYAFFLGALFVIASGLAFLETSANPLMLVLGPPEGAARRINLAQSFNPVGNIVGVTIGQHFILSGVEPTQAQLAAMPPSQLAAFFAREGHAVQIPYLLLGGFVLLWALVVFVTRFPAVAETPEHADRREPRAFLKLFRHRHFLLGALAQFFYVGGQVGVWSFTIRYAQFETGVGEKIAANYLNISLICFLIGRFAGTGLIAGRIAPARLMGLYAIANIVLALTATFAGGTLGLYALIAVSFFMSIMFPTIFALSLDGMGPLTKPGSSFLVMAIVGGAIMPAIMGWISDLSAINYAMLVPAACFAVVLLFSIAPKDVPRKRIA
jgi:FHS family L-fucose permease-like MFS transporter